MWWCLFVVGVSVVWVCLFGLCGVMCVFVCVCGFGLCEVYVCLCCVWFLW